MDLNGDKRSKKRNVLFCPYKKELFNEIFDKIFIFTTKLLKNDQRRKNEKKKKNENIVRERKK